MSEYEGIAFKSFDTYFDHIYCFKLIVDFLILMLFVNIQMYFTINLNAQIQKQPAELLMEFCALQAD